MALRRRRPQPAVSAYLPGCAHSVTQERLPKDLCPAIGATGCQSAAAGDGDCRYRIPAIQSWRESQSLTASSRTPCKFVPLAIAISLKRAAVSRGIEIVIFVSVFSSRPRGFVRKWLTFRFLISSFSPLPFIALKLLHRPKRRELQHGSQWVTRLLDYYSTSGRL